MEIEEILTHIEKTLIEDIDAMSHKDRAGYYISAKEFLQAKLQRATAAPYKHDDTEITIKVISSKKDLPEDGV